MLLLCQTPSYCADQWSKATPAGTDSIADLDTIIVQNNNSLDRLNYLARWKGKIVYATASTLTGQSGAAAIPNAGGTIVRWRRNTSNTTITWSNIDTGSEETSTTYYVYLTADVDETTYRFLISENATTPTGVTYYRKVASFYNNSSGNIEQVSDDEAGGFTIGAWVNYSSSGSVRDSYNVSSVSDDGTGDSQVTFATSFSNDDYAAVCSCHDNYNGDDEDPNYCAAYDYSTGSVSLKAHDDENEAVDCNAWNVIVFGR